MGVLIYFTNEQSFFSVRLLLSIVFINLTSPVGMHLVARAYRTGAYMYRKDDALSRSSILLSSKEYNSTEELKNRARIREERREKIYYDVQKRQKEKRKKKYRKFIGS